MVGYPFVCRTPIIVVCLIVIQIYSITNDVLLIPYVNLEDTYTSKSDFKSLLDGKQL